MPVARVQYMDLTGMVHLVYTNLALGLCISRESDNHVNVGPVTVGDVKNH